MFIKVGIIDNPVLTKLRMLKNRALKEYKDADAIATQAKDHYDHACVAYYKACMNCGYCGACEKPIELCACLSLA